MKSKVIIPNSYLLDLPSRRESNKKLPRFRQSYKLGRHRALSDLYISYIQKYSIRNLKSHKYYNNQAALTKIIQFLYKNIDSSYDLIAIISTEYPGTSKQRNEDLHDTIFKIKNTNNGINLVKSTIYTRHVTSKTSLKTFFNNSNPVYIRRNPLIIVTTGK
ncbi:hypothetical protein LSA03_12730 [Pediococcus argentinicus]|nr:hypothetical protein LSA03_12730 [Pediococcus argentinicus]